MIHSKLIWAAPFVSRRRLTGPCCVGSSLGAKPHTSGGDGLRRLWRINQVMGIRKRVAFAAALATFAAAALGATTDRSAAEPAREGAATKAGRLVAFGSCPDLLRYSKAQATRFVGPYGLGGRPGIVNDAAARAREASPPKQGVDFSGTNVQEEGVDEPDMVKTDGNTLYALANGKLNAVDVSSAKPRLLDTLALDPRPEPRAAPARQPPARPLARRLLGRADARDGQPDDAVRAGSVRARGDRRLESESSAPRPHADPRRGVRRRSARRRQCADRRHLTGAQHAAVRAAARTAPRRSSPRRASATAPLSPRPASGAGCRRTRSSDRE